MADDRVTISVVAQSELVWQIERTLSGFCTPVDLPERKNGIVISADLLSEAPEISVGISGDWNAVFEADGTDVFRDLSGKELPQRPFLSMIPGCGSLDINKVQQARDILFEAYKKQHPQEALAKQVEVVLKPSLGNYLHVSSGTTVSLAENGDIVFSMPTENDNEWSTITIRSDGTALYEWAWVDGLKGDQGGSENLLSENPISKETLNRVRELIYKDASSHH